MIKDIKKSLKSTIALSILLMTAITGFCQFDAAVQEIDGRKFYMHRVEKGHTLYAISQLYKVEVENITDNNPEALRGLKVGQTLKIPVNPKNSGTRWTNPIRIEGTYMIHKVMKKETLFSISKQYSVDINTILEENPDANTGIHKGQELRIPVIEIEPDDLSDIKPAKEDSLLQHKVLKGETLYAISKQYDVSLEKLNEVNDHFPEGLKTGAYIRIPKLNEDFKLQTEPVKYKPVITDKQPLKKSYNISLLLPFYLNYLDSSRNTVKQKKLREISISFYRGSMLALDTLEVMGLTADIRIDDLNDDLTTLNEISKNDNLKDAHLIIGPLQRAAINEVARSAKRQGTHVVCPSPQQNKILLSNPNLSKIQSSTSSELEALSTKVAENHEFDNIIILETGFASDQRNVEIVQAGIAAYFQKESSDTVPKIQVHSCEKKSVGDLNEKLDMSRVNAIVAPTSEKVLISDMLNKLAQVNEDYYDIVLYGMEEWMNMKFIDPEHQNRFNIHIPRSVFVDHNDIETLNFIRSFRDEYNSEPDDYAFLAYDIMRYYGEGLIKYGSAFPAHFEEIEYSGISTRFNMVQTGIESGFSNDHVFILEYKDYQLVLAD